MSAASGASMAIAILSAVGAGFGGFRIMAERRRRSLRKRKVLEAVSGEAARTHPARDLQGLGLRYAESLTRRLYTGATEPISPPVRAKQAQATRAGRRYLARAAAAGCSKEVSASAFCEAKLRCGLACAAAGALAGAAFSLELSALLCVTGALAGYTEPDRSLKSACRRRALDAERHLSEMLEVVSLGLRSGLSFDLSFALYGSHFESEFAEACGRAYRRWALGLSTREESLDMLASSYECEQLRRVTDGIVRSLRLGTSLTGVLEEAASQSRATYRAALEERVAKAPVKMMLPTGTLILPAMLLMVLGPVLLELAGGF